jgi:hypothetical protein
METLNVSEQQAEQIHGEGGSVGTEPAAQMSSAASEPVMASALESSPVGAPAIAPDHEAPPKDETPKVRADEIDTVKIDPIKVDKAAVERAKESLLSGRLLIMSPKVRAWQTDAADAKAQAEPISEPPAKRRYAGMAAVVALAALAGALSGAFATVGVLHLAAADAASTSGSQALDASVARIDADILALKAGLEHAAKTGVSQFNKTSDRLDKVEKAQAEPASKLAKLSEAMDRLHIPPAAPAAAAAATPAAPPATRDITGSVTPPSANAMAASSASSTAPPAPAAPPKTEAARLPTVDGWVLRDVNHGGALIEGRQGLYEVYAGDPVPGLGKVDAIRKQDGRWVVVTTKGLVIAR